MMSGEFFQALLAYASPHEWVPVLTKTGVKLCHSPTYRADLTTRVVKRIHW